MTAAKKPKPNEWLTLLRPEARTYEHLDTCHICGARAWGDMQLWRECDDNDQPIRGDGALVVVCQEKACQAAIEKHPRLYVEEHLGAPGHFPPLCIDCAWRRWLECSHPHLKANGGKGLAVKVGNSNAIICAPGHGGCMPAPRRATECEGQRGGPAAVGGGGPRAQEA